MSVDSQTVNSLDELKKFAKELSVKFTDRQVVLLNGPMGAGKTQLVRYLVEAMGGKAVSSPTFAIHNEYQVKRGLVDHVDLYRLESEAELEATGFWDLFARPEGLILVEWADRLPNTVWPPSWKKIEITISVNHSNSRQIRCQAT